MDRIPYPKQKYMVGVGGRVYIEARLLNLMQYDQDACFIFDY